MGTLTVVLLVLVLFLVGINTVVLIKLLTKSSDNNSSVDKSQSEQLIQTSVLEIKNVVEHTDRTVSDSYTLLAKLSGKLDVMESMLSKSDTATMEFVKLAREDLERIRTTVDTQMKGMRDDNAKQLDKMRETVDEKLQDTLNKRLNESFEQVSVRLEQVYKGLGEMQTLAEGVGDLKKVLSNVKTRGIVGEYQLQAILEDMLSPGQYEYNVATIPGSTNRVEFAIKIPTEGDGFIWLPVDSKFPGDSYQALVEAQDSGNADAVERARKQLVATMKAEAKDIHEKYVEVPHTTEFGIMFLPTEGLYAEAVRLGVVEMLQREYRVNIAGPSTMAALLNSLQMAFRTIAIQRRSDEVWKVLGIVKTEFDKFEGVLAKAQDQVDRAGKQLELLSGTRTRAMKRVLRGVESLPDTDGILGLPEMLDEE